MTSNIVVGENIEMTQITPSIVSLMKYLHKYLDENWKINKKNSSYILKRNDCKVIICEGMYINPSIVSHHNTSVKYILGFLYNSLNDGWTVKKTNNNYIFIKNHEGKKEILSNEYIDTFIKDNFNFNLIK